MESPLTQITAILNSGMVTVIAPSFSTGQATSASADIQPVVHAPVAEPVPVEPAPEQ